MTVIPIRRAGDQSTADPSTGSSPTDVSAPLTRQWTPSFGDQYSGSTGSAKALARRTPTPIDPDAQVHHADRPTPRTVRLVPIDDRHRGRLVLRNAVRLGWRAVGVVLRHRRDPERLAEIVIQFATETGGFWSRIPAFLSNHRFAFPDRFCQRLLEWREHSDGFPFADVRRVVENDLGRPLEDVFETFDENPITATVTAQTHKAKLKREQTIVAVKVQRPGIAEVMRTDLSIARRLRPLLVWLSGIPGNHWDDGLWRVESGIAQELDYRLEATYMTRMGRRLGKHQVLVPGLYLRHSGPRTLTKDFVSGVTVAEFVKVWKTDRPRAEAWLRENEIDPKKVGRRIFNSLMRQILEEDLFDRDWNPYNTLILKGSRLAIVDFWAMVSIERSFQARMRTLLRAIAQREFRKAADYFVLIGPPVAPTHDASEVRRQIIHALRMFDVQARAKLLPYQEKALTNVFGEIARILAEDGTPPTSDFLEVDRAFRIADLSLKDLLTDVNVMQMHERFWDDADIRQLRDTLSRRQLRASITSAIELIAKSPDFLSEQLAVGADIIRRQAKVFQQTSSKIARLFESTFGLITRGFLAVGVVLVSAFVFQEFPAARPYFALAGPRILHLLETLPAADTFEGGVLLFVVLYLLNGSWRLERQFAEKTATRPDSSEA